MPVVGAGALVTKNRDKIIRIGFSSHIGRRRREIITEPNRLGQDNRVLKLALAARVGIVHETQQLHVQHVRQLDQRKRPFGVLVAGKKIE
jgi:hypothetical protein